MKCSAAHKRTLSANMVTLTSLEMPSLVLKQIYSPKHPCYCLLTANELYEMPFGLIVRSRVQIVVALVDVPGEQQNLPAGLDLGNHGALNAIPGVDDGGAREEPTKRVVAPLAGVAATLDKGKQVAANSGLEATDGAGPSTSAVATPKRKKVRFRSSMCSMCNVARLLNSHFATPMNIIPQPFLVGPSWALIPIDALELSI
jgi:hypothetical protein